jgi:hypothetical protein
MKSMSASIVAGPVGRYSLRVLSIAGDASRDVVSNSTASALVALAVLLVASAIGALWVSRNRETSSGAVAWFAAFGSIAGCLALTLFREGFQFGFRPASVLAWTTSGWDRLADSDLVGSSQFLLNVALFVPAGVAWTLVTGRPFRTFGGLLGLTMLIESVQGATGVGGADIADVVANAIGAALGVAAAAITIASTPSNQRRAIVAAGLVVAVAVTATALVTGADRRQAEIHDQLETVFADTTYDEINAVLNADVDNPAPFDDDARFVDSEQIFGAISVRSVGARYSTDQIELRWPALYFGFRRCVFVTWTPSGVDFSDASGRVCTDFLG